LESAYLENESDALVQAWREEGIELPQLLAMPSVQVQGVPLNFEQHAWALESEHSEASPLIPVRVEGCAEPIAFMRCCFLALNTEDGKKRKGKSTVKSDRRWLHGQKLDGAYLVMHGRKVQLCFFGDAPSLPRCRSFSFFPLSPFLACNMYDLEYMHKTESRALARRLKEKHTH
jgi:hypothetical protein